ncbi:MAG: DUF420 domain-containing protein [Actinomycetota bacterium]
MTDVRVPVPEPVRRALDVPVRRAAGVIGLASAVAIALLLWLVIGVDAGGESSSRTMPLVNAALNLGATAFLVRGWRHVRAGRLVEHRDAMLGALACSGLFLVGYLVHHTLHGDTAFGADGWLRGVYLALLGSHVLLSIVGLPAVLATAWSATTGRFTLHRRTASATLPVWLYVSATGAAVALMLRFLG